MSCSPWPPSALQCWPRPTPRRTPPGPAWPRPNLGELAVLEDRTVRALPVTARIRGRVRPAGKNTCCSAEPLFLGLEVTGPIRSLKKKKQNWSKGEHQQQQTFLLTHL